MGRRMKYFYGIGKKDRRTALLLSGQTYHVTRELASALRRVFLEKESRLLLIQSIYINVSDLSGRNNQIAMLREILKTSQRLLVWLGDVGLDLDLLFRYLQKHEQKLNQPSRVREPRVLGRYPGNVALEVSPRECPL
jgi:hypothetical protein